MPISLFWILDCVKIDLLFFFFFLPFKKVFVFFYFLHCVYPTTTAHSFYIVSSQALLHFVLNVHWVVEEADGSRDREKTFHEGGDLIRSGCCRAVAELADEAESIRWVEASCATLGPLSRSRSFNPPGPPVLPPPDNGWSMMNGLIGQLRMDVNTWSAD